MIINQETVDATTDFFRAASSPNSALWLNGRWSSTNGRYEPISPSMSCEMPFTNWGVGEGNTGSEQCVQVGENVETWNDKSCGASYPVMCHLPTFDVCLSRF